MYLKINDKQQMVVDCYAMEVYLPHEYMDSAYRGAPYYSVLGTKIRFLGVGNMRFFMSEKDLNNPENVKVHPLGVPMLLMSEPEEIDIQEIKLSKTGPARKFIILRYMKGSVFLTNVETIKGTDAMMMVLARLEQGKLDTFPPEVAVSIVRDCESMNGISLRIPSEEMEIFVAERYRDPNHPTRKYRYHTGKLEDPTSMVSHNMRTDAHQSTTYQSVMHEDINAGLLAAVNRKDRGEYDEPLMMESLMRGLSLDEFKKADNVD